MHDVFLSYPAEDEASAAVLAEELRAQGLSFWWDRQLNPAEDTEAAILQALRDATTVVVVASQPDLAPNSLMELGAAIALGKTVKLWIPTGSIKPATMVSRLCALSKSNRVEHAAKRRPKRRGDLTSVK